MRSFAIPVVLLAAAVAVPAMAQPGPGHFHRGGPLLEGVTLTDAQKAQVSALMQSSHQNNKETFHQLRAVHEQIDAALVGSGTVTEASLQPLLQQEEALQAKMEEARVSDELAIRNILTADQLSTAAATQAKLASLREQEQALRQHDAAPPPPPAD